MENIEQKITNFASVILLFILRHLNQFLISNNTITNKTIDILQIVFVLSKQIYDSGLTEIIKKYRQEIREYETEMC